MRLTSLGVEGFRVFAERSEISIPPSGLINIVGDREGGGSSGSGKTSVLQAINFVLGTSSFAASRQQSWLTKTPIQVDLGLATEDGSERLLLRRGKVTSATVNDVVVAKGSTEYNKWLEEYFGMDSKLLQVLTFRAQRAPALFMGLRPAEKRAFLGAVLGLEKFENLAKAIGEQISGLQKEEAVKAGVIAQLPKPPPVPAPMRDFAIGDERLDSESWSKRIDQLKACVDEARRSRDAAQVLGDTAVKHVAEARAEREKALSALRAEKAAVLAAIKPPQAPKPDVSLQEERMTKLHEKQQNAMKLADGLSMQIQETTRLTEEARRRVVRDEARSETLRSQVASLEANRCDTCGQPWHDQQRLEDLRAELAKTTQLLAQNQDLIVKYQADIPGWQAQIQEAKQVAAKMEEGKKVCLAEVKKIQEAAVQQAAAETVEYRRAHKEASDHWDARIADHDVALMTRVSTAQLRVSEYQEAIGKHSTEGAELLRRIATINDNMEMMRRHNVFVEAEVKRHHEFGEKLAKLADELVEIKARLAEKQDLQAAVRAFMGAFSEEMLAEIGTEANAMLAALPNVTGVGLRFSTETLTEAGARQEIKVVLTSGKNDDIDGDSQLSGGQMTSVELAVDRAVSKVLRRRHGGQRLPSWLIFDESFNGYDTQTREACLEFLRADVGEGQVFIVDHAAELREAFQSTIRVTQGADGSKISIES